MEQDRQHSRFKISWGGDLLVFFISLLLALIVWGIMKLSANYRYLYHYQVEITSPLDGRVFRSVSQDALTIRGASSGFHLLRYKSSVKNKSNILTFKVAPDVLKKLEGHEDAFFLHSSALKERLSEILDGSVSVEEIVSDTLVFLIPRTFQKKVPVCLRSDISFTSQYMPLERISLSPDSVLIMGDENIVLGIDSVFTQKVFAREVDGNIHGVAEIVQIPGVQMSESEVVYSLRAGRYVERTVVVDIEARNVPQGRKMIFVPSTVKIVFREEYGLKKPLEKEDFVAVADYLQTAETESGKARVQLDGLPSGVLGVSIDPLFVDRIIVE